LSERDQALGSFAAAIASATRPALLIVQPGLEGGAGGVLGFDGPGGGMSAIKMKEPTTGKR